MAISTRSGYNSLVDEESPLTLLTQQANNEKQQLLETANELQRRIRLQVRPWQKNEWQTWASAFLTLLSAGASASCSPYLANQVLEAEKIQAFLFTIFNKDDLPTLKVLTAIASSVPSFTLSANAGINTWNDLTRTQLNLKQIYRNNKNNWPPLLATVLSAFVSFNISWDAWHNDYELKMFLSSFRFFSALATNGVFSVNQWKKWRGYKDCPEALLVRHAKEKLNRLAREYPDEFIEQLHRSGLFRIISTARAPSDQYAFIRHLFNALTSVLENDYTLIPEAPAVPSNISTPGWKERLAPVALYGTSLASTASYFTSGKRFVTNVMELNNAGAEYVLGSILGISSVLVNASIAASSITDVVTRLNNWRNDSTETQFNKETLAYYPLKVLTWFFVVGYASSNAGMGFAYPTPKNEVIGYIEAALYFMVYFAIGDMAIDKFFTQIYNKSQTMRYKFVENAKDSYNAGSDIRDFYRNLPDNKSKLLFIRLINDDLKWPLNYLSDTFSYMDEPIRKGLLAETPASRYIAKNYPDSSMKRNNSLLFGNSLPTAFEQGQTARTISEQKSELAPTSRSTPQLHATTKRPSFFTPPLTLDGDQDSSYESKSTTPVP